jgi:cell division protein FtsW (lipid II flippase)
VSFAIAALAAVAVFLVCAWSGQTLARHHQDRQEIGAVVAIGVCVLGTLALSRNLFDVSGMVPLLGLAVAAGGGLFLGFDRADRTR